MRSAVITDCFRQDINHKHIQLSSDDILLLTLMQYFKVLNYKNKYSLIYTMGMIIDVFNITGRETIKSLYTSFDYLVDQRLIVWENSSQKVNRGSTLICKLPKIDASFTYINLDFVDKIMESKYDIRSKKNMLYLYIIIQSYKGNSGTSYQSIDTMAKIMSVSNKTIIDNLKKLSDIDVIAYENAGLVHRGDDIVKLPNIYVTKDTLCWGDKLKEGLLQKQHFTKHPTLSFFEETPNLKGVQNG